MVYIILGEAYLKLEEPDKAKKAYKTATGKWGEKYYLKIATKYEKTDPDKTVKHLQRDIFLKPTDFSAKMRCEPQYHTHLNIYKNVKRLWLNGQAGLFY